MALTDNLVSYWKLDESSGNATDAHGSNTLTDNGSVGSATGLINTARDFESTLTQYLSHADNADLSTGDIDFEFTAWVKLESLPASGSAMVIVGKYATDPNGEYFLRVNNVGGVIRFDFGVVGLGSQQIVKADNFGTPSAGVWYFVSAGYNAGTDTSYISVNNGTQNTRTSTIGPADSTSAFAIGSYGGLTSVHRFDGLIDEVGFWKRTLTSGERTTLYNGGAGLAYPFTSASIIPLVVHHRKQQRAA